MDSTTIEQMIRAGLPEAEVSVRGDDGVHFEAEVISAEFAGKTRIQQHQMVYQALRGKMGDQLHALALQTAAPK